MWSKHSNDAGAARAAMVRSAARSGAIGALLLGLIGWPVAAHDLWLQPSRFWIAPGGEVPAVLLVGHGAARERSRIAASQVSLFKAIGPRGSVDRKGELSLGQGRADASLKFDAPGTYVVFFSTTNVESVLPAPKFNDYAAGEGLTLVTGQRIAQGSTSAPGRELYSRRGKALIQVGSPGHRAQAHVTAPVGLSLEIVPLRNPYQAGTAASLPVRVLYQGRPLAGALVKMTNLAADSQPVEAHRTDASGLATFKARRSGEWQLNVVWSEPLGNRRARC